MIAVVVATEAGCGHDLYDLLERFGTVRRDDPTRMTAEQEGRWVMLAQTDTVAGAYEPEDMERMRERLDEPEFFVLQVSEPSLVADCLRSISSNKTVVVDNDYGWIDDLNAYKQAIDRGEDWLHCANRP